MNQPISDKPGLTRRELLTVGAAVVAVAACGDDGSSTPADAATVTDSATDSAVQPDSAAQPDAAADSAVQPDAATDSATPTDVTQTDSATPTDAAADSTTAPDASTTPDAAADSATATDASTGTDAAADSATTPDAAVACPPAGATMLGALSAFAVGSWRNVKAANVIVGRDSRGLFAYSARCTHSGCTVPAPASSTAGSTCPCHGSRFNADGMVTGGPASRSLDNYEVIVCGGNVYLNMARTVAVGTRAAVS